MKLNKAIAIPAIALAAGISLAACGNHPAVHMPTPTTSQDPMIPVSGAMIPAGRGGGGTLAVSGGPVASLNWSGYVASGRYTSVSANWTEPSVNCPLPQVQYSAFWAGLDGYKSRSVEQSGTISACDGTTPFYYAWYEMYPAGMVAFTNHVYPGDHFTSSVTVRSGAHYTLKLSDVTRGWSHTVNITHRGLADSSAEVIAEAPSSNSGILPLADFGNAYFSSSKVNGHAMGSVPHTRIVMENNSSQAKDYVSPLIASNRNFHVTWARSS
jgi:hypothetical protein